MRRTVGVKWRRHVDNAGGSTGLGNAALVVLAEFERPQHLELGLFASGGDLLVAGLGGAGGRKLVGAKRLEFDDIGPRPRGGPDQRQGAAAVAVMVNASLGNDRGSAMHGFPSADIRAIEIAPPNQAVVLVE